MGCAGRVVLVVGLVVLCIVAEVEAGRPSYGRGTVKGQKKARQAVVEEWTYDAANTRLQAPSPQRSARRLEELAQRREALQEAMAHAWKGYRECAFGADDLKPISCSASNWLSRDTAPAVSARFFDKSLPEGCLEEGLTGSIADALDTLLLMGMEEEVAEAVRHMDEHLCFEKSNQVIDVFETIIRVLGGLLSASQQLRDGGEDAFLGESDLTRGAAAAIAERKARTLSQRVKKAFWSATGLPAPVSDLIQGASIESWNSKTKLALVGTNSLEFMELAKRMEDMEDMAEHAGQVLVVLQAAMEEFGADQLPVYIRAMSGVFETDNELELGPGADSAFEYLLKTALVLLQRQARTGAEASLPSKSGTAVTADALLHLYNTAVHGLLAEVLHVAANGSEYVSASTVKFRVFVSPRDDHMHHLTCFLPGMLALGAAMGSPHAEEDLETAEALMETCMGLQRAHESGLAAEVSSISPRARELSVTAVVKEYKLRPEVAESLFVLHRITGKEQYADYAWEVFSAIERSCRVPHGYSGVRDVTVDCAGEDSGEEECAEELRFTDEMPSYFLAETLKYLYLTFASFDTFSLDDYVFNTEAHPFRF
mmetsp:Transcript_2291/g.8157  ORF Transcript_2291/g.8157 Transcript_2291/m.8157 type:complete len:598 (-) Transcript_2291:32-1825(-)